MLLSRTAAAFTFTAERLAKEFGQLYFWTFTFVKVPINDETAMKDFHCFMSRLCWHYPDLRGVRVCELHRSHGIHFHALVNLRLPIQRVKAIAHGTWRPNGRNRYLDFGRMSVSEADASAIGYLAKYLTKDYRKRFGFGGRRRWGTIGGFDGCKVRDVVFENDATRNRDAIFGTAKCRYTTFLMIIHYTALYGLVKNWPVEARALVMKQSMEHGGDWMKYRRAHEPF